MLVSLDCLFLPSSLFIFSFQVLFSRKKTCYWSTPKYSFMPLNINFFFCDTGVHLHSHSQWMPFTQAASLRQADKEMDSRESLKRLSLVAETLNRKLQNQEANGDRTGLNDSRAAEGTGRWSCQYWTAPKNQIHASH